MKKLTAMILAGAMMFCGAMTAGAAAPAEEPEAAAEQEAAVPEGLAELAEGLVNLLKPGETGASYGYRGDETVEEQVLFEENGLKATAVGLGYVSYAPVLKMKVENTSGKELTFELTDSFLNGWSWDASLCRYTEGDDASYEETSEIVIADGETVSCGLGFSNEFYFEKCGILAFSEIGLRIRAYEAEDWENTMFMLQGSVATSAADEDTDGYAETGTTAWDAEGIRILIAQREEEEYGGTRVYVYVDNQSEKDVTVMAESCLVNRQERDPWFGADVPAGSRALNHMWFDGDIGSVNRLEASFRIQEKIPFYYEEPEVIGISDPVVVEFEDGLSDLALSPEWVAQLEQAETANQLFVVAAVGETTAYVSMHTKDQEGNWKEVFTTPGFIGKKGLGKTMEGDGKTPVGTFHFNYAFGIAENPGSVLPYHQVTEDNYWSGDVREGYHYNEMVDIQDLPDLDQSASEHIVDYMVHYQYCLNISYNKEGTPGLGSAIFLHCLAPQKPYTGGCVAIPQDKMILALQNASEDCVVLIDTLENLCPDYYADWGLAPEEME